MRQRNERHDTVMARVGAPMAVRESLVWKGVGDQVAHQTPPTDPICTFHVLFKFLKRILFQNIVRPLHSSSNRFPFEAACCSVGLLSARLFLSDTDAVDAARFCRVHHNPHGFPRGVVVQHHDACGPPTFPTLMMDKIFACNHILLSHLVSGDAVTVIIEQVLRKAMVRSKDFFVVLSFVVDNMQKRARKYSSTGYAFEAITVTFQNYVLFDKEGKVTRCEEEVEEVTPCQWSITFPARKTFAAFVANRQLWLKLDHVPVFNALEVGQTMAAEMKREPTRHTVSPLLWKLLTHQRTKTTSASAREGADV